MNYDQIWKYTLDNSPDRILHGFEMPVGAKFLHIAQQDGSPCYGSPCFWMKVDSSQPKAYRSVYMAPTGKQPGAFVPSDDHADYMGTLFFRGGFVGHFFLEKGDA